MKESNQMIENRLKRAIESSVPDVLPKLLEQIEQEEESNKMNATNEKILPLSGKEDRPARRWKYALAPAAAAILLLFGAWFGYSAYATQAVVAFDVNPSIELSVNRKEKILQVKPRNEEGETVVGTMKLKGVDLDVAVNALIGSMVRNGYITEFKNSILITVDSRNTERGDRLQKHLSDEVSELLRGFSLQGAILSQTSRSDHHYQELAAEHSISPGKAALIEQLVKQDPGIRFTDVARLSINDINLLISSRQATLEGVSVTGTASAKEYIGDERAKEIALDHAGVREKDTRKLEVELDYDDGRMVYEVEFYLGNTEYDYEIDAKSGRILEFKSKEKGGAAKPPVQTGQYIGQDKAEKIALDHAGLSRSVVRKLEAEMERKQNRVFYEIEFEHGNKKYEYKIEAESGAIIEVEIEKTRDGNGSSSPPTTTQGTTGKQGEHIGAGRAEEIALNHAGLKRSQVSDFEIELKDRKSPPYYEVEFKYGGYEYEYEIHAESGKILEFEKEID